MRSVRPEICVVSVESGSVGDSISACREGERKSIVPRRPTTYSRPPTSWVLDSPDVRRMVIVAVPVDGEVDTPVISALGKPSYSVQSRWLEKGLVDFRR